MCQQIVPLLSLYLLYVYKSWHVVAYPVSLCLICINAHTSISFFFPSDESLLQEDNAEFNSLNSEFTSCVCLGEPSDASTLTSKIGRYGHGHNQANPSSKFLSSNQRYATESISLM